MLLLYRALNTRVELTRVIPYTLRVPYIVHMSGKFRLSYFLTEKGEHTRLVT